MGCGSGGKHAFYHSRGGGKRGESPRAKNPRREAIVVLLVIIGYLICHAIAN